MSGHSKWSTIKRQKGAADARRGQMFTKLSNAITIAVKQGGGITDPEINFKLRLAIDRARGSNMPKENIDRAIKKAEGVDAGEVEEFLYEGFAPGGVALMITAVTDNKQRTVSTIKNVLEKNGGVLVSQGAVSYLFNKRGELNIDRGGLSSDELLSRGVNAGVEDMKEEDNNVFFYTDPSRLQQTKEKLKEQGIYVISAELVFVPSTYVKQDEAASRKILSLVEKLKELDDVQEVVTNAGLILNE